VISVQQSLHVEALSSAIDLQPLEWDGLVERAGSPFFYTHAWLRAYEETAPETIAACWYLTARDASGALVAALPAYLTTASPFWGGYAIESGLNDPVFSLPMLVTPCWYAFHSVLCADIATEQALPPLLAAAEEAARAGGAALLAFPGVPEGHPLLAALKEHGFLTACIDAGHVRVECGAGRGGVPVPDADAHAAAGAAWLASLKTDTRRDMRRRARRSQEAGATFSLTLDPGQVEPFVALTDATCAKHGIRPLYTAAFLHGLRQRCGAALTFPHLEADGRLLGGFLGFRHRGTFYAWCGGIDIESLPHFSTYVVTLYHTMKWALGSGCLVVDMGRGNHEFKMKHGFRPLRLYLCIKALTPEVAGRLPGFMSRLEASLAVPATLQGLEAQYGTFASTFYAPRPRPGQPY